MLTGQSVREEGCLRLPPGGARDFQLLHMGEADRDAFQLVRHQGLPPGYLPTYCGETIALALVACKRNCICVSWPLRTAAGTGFAWFEGIVYPAGGVMRT